MPPRGLPTLVVLPPVASSSVAPLSPASFCIATAACRSLALAAFPASRRSSALLAAYFGPSSLSSSPLARTTLLTPTPNHLPTRHVVTKPLPRRVQLKSTRGSPSGEPLRKSPQSTGIPCPAQTRRSLGRRALLRGHLNSRAAAPRQSTHPPRRHKQERR